LPIIKDHQVQKLPKLLGFCFNFFLIFSFIGRALD